jgi:PEP-CTERM motif
MERIRLALTCTVVFFLPTAGSAQVLLGRIDDFQAGTTDTLGWTNGGVNSPIVVAGGGPLGVGDNFLQIMATGGIGPGSRLISFNRTRWNGNFLAAGSPGAVVTSVAMDLKVTSGTPLQIRIAMKSGMLQNAPGYSSTTPFDLPADGAWHHVDFGIDAASLTAIGGPSPLDVFLQNVVEFRILHSVAPALDGDSITANLGVDNITPVGVPEPSALVLAGAGVLALTRRRRNSDHAQSRS